MKPFFAGRETDIQRLMAFAQDAFLGNASVSFITGEAGIGKTTLAEKLIARLQSDNQDMVVASGKCTVYEASYLPFRSILETLVNSEKRFAGNSEKSRKLIQVMFDTIWSAGPDLIGIFGIPIKALQSAVEKHGLRTKIQMREMIIPKDLDPNQIYGWYTKIIQEISEKFPLILFLDDLHWADESSLNLLFHLGRELENNKIFLIASYRPHDVNPDSRLFDIKTRLERYGAQEFSLDVSKEESGNIDKIRNFIHAYLTGNYGTNFSERFESLLADRTGGNALFLTEILKNMEEKRQIVCFQEEVEGKQATQWKLAKKVETIEELPKKVESVIKERIDRLKKGLREILTYGSVEGDDFLAQVIAKAKQIDDWALIDDLTENLMSIFQLIWERGGKSLPNGDRVHEFSFRHNLLREYVYAQIPKSKKEHLHAQIGACLERLYEPNTNEIAGTLANHFRLGYVMVKAVSYSLKAAQEANLRYGTAEAVRFSNMGFEALEESRKNISEKNYAEKKVQLLIELAKAEKYGGNHQEKKDHIQAGLTILEENLELLKNVSERLLAEYYTQLGTLYQRKGGELQETKTYLEKALFLHETNKDSEKIAELLYLLSNVYENIQSTDRTLSPFQRCIDALNKSLNISNQLCDANLQTKILSRLTYKYMRDENFRFAQIHAKNALKLLKTHSNITPYSKIKAYRAIAVIYRRYSKHKTSLTYERKALEISQKTGNVFEESLSLNNIGVDYFWYIHSKKEAQQALEASISIKERMGSKRTTSLNNLGWNIFLKQGKWEEAKDCWRKAMAQSDEKGRSLCIYYIGRLYSFQERYAEAEKKFLHRISMLEKYSSPKYNVYLATAQNYARLGNEIESKRLLDTANNLFKKKIVSPRSKAIYLSNLAETYFILRKYKSAKTACEDSLTWFLCNAENPEQYQFVAETRLIMGKILVDMQNFQEAIKYLDKAKTAFGIGKHYALGETILYIGKAYSGIGNQSEAKLYLNEALVEFQRLELFKKEKEAREILSNLMD